MMKPMYILSAAAISPQHSFGEEVLSPIMHSDNGRLFVQDPDYSKFINPVAIRRMSRLIKMGISAGMRSLELAGIAKPDAIITGTGRGSMNDTEHFLNDLIRMNEEALNPTYFIQSTYNSINGWLAMQTKCTGYNQTYVHRGFSLEWALLDAQMMLNEADQPIHILTGSFDEMTDEYYLVKSKVGYWKKPEVNSLELFLHQTPGTIGGEGTAFFTLSNEAKGDCCAIKGMHMLQDPADTDITNAVTNMLEQHSLSYESLDLVLAGMNGDARHNHIYDAALKDIPTEVTIASFKHLCGEYDTSTGFALWLADRITKTGIVPESIIYHKGRLNVPKYILLVNHYILNSVSIMLLEICQ